MHVISDIPLISPHLLNQDIKSRILHTEVLGIRHEGQPAQHHDNFDQSQDRQDIGEGFELGLGCGGSYLHHAGEEENVEDEGDDPEGKGYFHFVDEVGRGFVGYFVDEYQHQPK